MSDTRRSGAATGAAGSQGKRRGPVGFAVIGAGLVGPRHAEFATKAEGAKLAVVCDLREDRGRPLAEKLGDQAVVLMRGHGATVVGPSLKAAVYRSVYAEVNAGLQLAALRLGEPVYLSEAEAIAAYRTNSAQIERAWQLWLDEIGQ